MSILRTVLGDVSTEGVDKVLPHEHLLCDFSRVTRDRNHIFNNPATAIQELAEVDVAVRPAPGRRHAVVEVTPRDLGRDPAGLIRIAKASNVHVVMSTGWYLEPYYPVRVYETSAAALAEEMVHEIEVGVDVDGERVRAGMIGEIGTDGPLISPAEERVLRAAARAAKATGSALTTHAFMYPSGLGQLAVLEEEGVSPTQVAIGHVDTFLDIEYHRELLRRGVFLQFDTCGREHLMPDTERVKMILRLLDEGWVDSILLSSDRCHRTDLKLHGGLGYSWTFAGFTDLLLEAGVGADEVETMVRTNPLRLLGGLASS